MYWNMNLSELYNCNNKQTVGRYCFLSEPTTYHISNQGDIEVEPTQFIQYFNKLNISFNYHSFTFLYSKFKEIPFWPSNYLSSIIIFFHFF
jgi:hypothetical protein